MLPVCYAEGKKQGILIKNVFSGSVRCGVLNKIFMASTHLSFFFMDYEIKLTFKVVMFSIFLMLSGCGMNGELKVEYVMH